MRWYLVAVVALHLLVEVDKRTVAVAILHQSYLDAAQIVRLIQVNLVALADGMQLDVLVH